MEDCVTSLGGLYMEGLVFRILRYVSRFHASHMCRTVWKDLEIIEANENNGKVSGFHCFVFKFRLFLRVFYQLNLLR